MRHLRRHVAALAIAVILGGVGTLTPTSAAAPGRDYFFEWIGPGEGVCWVTGCCFWHRPCDTICCGVIQPF